MLETGSFALQPDAAIIVITVAIVIIRFVKFFINHSPSNKIVSSLFCLIHYTAFECRKSRISSLFFFSSPFNQAPANAAPKSSCFNGHRASIIT